MEGLPLENASFLSYIIFLKVTAITLQYFYGNVRMCDDTSLAF